MDLIVNEKQCHVIKSPKTLSIPILQLWWLAIRPLFLQFPNDLDDVQHCKTQTHIKNSKCNWGSIFVDAAKSVDLTFFFFQQKYFSLWIDLIQLLFCVGNTIWRCIFPNGRWRHGSFDANWPYDVLLDLNIRSDYHYAIDRNLENVLRTIFLPSHHYNIGKCACA